MRNETTGGGAARPRCRLAGLAAVLAGAALLAVACGGGSPGAGSTSSAGELTVQKVDAFAQCMRGHGVADFYPTKRTGTPSPPANGQVVLSISGYLVTGVNPQSAQFQSGMRACRHLLGLHPPTAAETHAQFVQALKSAACMRSHGYPDWPDPSTGPNGQGVFVPGPPAGVDVNSPQFQAAAKACGESVP